MRIEFKIVWSNKWWLIPCDKITKDGYKLPYTNRYKSFTYRLKPAIKWQKQ